MSVSVEDIAENSRIDYLDDKTRKHIEKKIKEAQIYVDVCVGQGYKKCEDRIPLADLLITKVAGDLFDNPDLRLVGKNNGYDQISNTILDILANCGEENV